MVVPEEWSEGYTEGWNDGLEILKYFIEMSNLGKLDKVKVIKKINEMFTKKD